MLPKYYSFTNDIYLINIIYGSMWHIVNFKRITTGLSSYSSSNLSGFLTKAQESNLPNLEEEIFDSYHYQG